MMLFRSLIAWFPSNPPVFDRNGSTAFRMILPIFKREFWSDDPPLNCRNCRSKPLRSPPSELPEALTKRLKCGASVDETDSTGPMRSERVADQEIPRTHRLASAYREYLRPASAVELVITDDAEAKGLFAKTCFLKSGVAVTSRVCCPATS